MAKDDMMKWEAENQVKTAFMETPRAKRLVKATVKVLKANQAKVRRALKKKA